MRWVEINEKRIRLEDSETILQNPSLPELKSFIQKCLEKSVRGYCDGKNVYVWDAMYSGHADMDAKLATITNGILSSTCFFIAMDKANLSPTWEVENRYREIEKVNGLFISSFTNMASENMSPYDILNFMRMIGLKTPPTSE